MYSYTVEGLDLARAMQDPSRILNFTKYIDNLQELCRKNAEASPGRSSQWETEIQALLVSALRSGVLSDVVMVHHSPMGGHRSAREGAELKRAGASAGWPDLDIRLRGGVGLLLELKAPGGRLSKTQQETLQKLSGCGFLAKAAIGLHQAVEIILEALEAVCERA